MCSSTYYVFSQFCANFLSWPGSSQFGHWLIRLSAEIQESYDVIFFQFRTLAPKIVNITDGIQALMNTGLTNVEPCRLFDKCGFLISFLFTLCYLVKNK